ncbi:MAG: ROK family protein [Anaerolineales bacterium]
MAVDLGGTHIRAAYFPKFEASPATLTKVETLASEGPDAVIERITQAIESQIPDGVEIRNLRIGIGAPGPLDPATGVVLDAPNLPGWVDFHLVDRMRAHFDCPIALGNDANMAALGEWRFGAGIDTQNLVFLIIGTGIGGGIINAGQLITGTCGLAGEVGHVSITSDGPRCGCGQSGHVEALAAGPAIARRAMAKLADGQASTLREKYEAEGSIRSEDIGRAAGEGDSLALETLEETGDILGRHLANLAHIFNPEIFVLGGGVSQIGEPFFQPIRAAFRKYVMHPAYLEGLRIVPATLGDDGGLVGAMILAHPK